MKNTVTRLLLLASVAALTACTADTTDPAAFEAVHEGDDFGAQEPPMSADSWVTVDKVAMEPGHEFEFRTLPSGELMIIEGGSIDEHTPYLASGAFDGWKPSDIYASLSPNGKTVPEAVRFADEIAVQQRVANLADVRRDVHEAEQVQDSSAAPPSPVAAPLTVPCMANVYTKYCDARKFNDSYCVGGVSRHCETNVQSSVGPWIPGALNRSTGMNAAFTGNAAFSIQRGDGGNAYAGALAPRGFKTVQIYMPMFSTRAVLTGSLVHLAQVRLASASSDDCSAWEWLKCEGIVVACAGVCWEGVTLPACVACMGGAYEGCKGCL